jgi:hypothetical protein
LDSTGTKLVFFLKLGTERWFSVPLVGCLLLRSLNRTRCNLFRFCSVPVSFEVAPCNCTMWLILFFLMKYVLCTFSVFFLFFAYFTDWKELTLN